MDRCKIGNALFLLGTLALLHVSWVHAQDLTETPAGSTAAQVVRTVEAMGNEPIEDHDFAKAREKAIQAGLVNAVMTVARDLVAGDGNAEAAVPMGLAARIQDQPAGFIRNYRVVEEDAGIDGETYMVLVEAEVAVAALERALGAKPDSSPEPVSRPALLLAVAEQGTDEFIPHYWWGGTGDDGVSEAARSLGRVLGQQGYPLVTHDTAARDSRFTARYTHPQLTDRQAVEMGAQLGADVVIHGQARAIPGPASLGTKISTFQGTLEVRALHVATGRLINELAETAVTVGTDAAQDSRKALQRAGAAVAEELLASLANLDQVPEGAMRELEITVSGTADLPRFVQLRRTITALPGVGDVQLLALEQDQARLQVAFGGSNERFRDLLKRRLGADYAVEPLDFTRLRISLPPSRPGAAHLQEKPLGN